MPQEEHLKQKVSKGLLWGGLNNGTQQLLNLIIGIFLARILTPADYGMVGVLTVFSAIAGALQEGGFISALTNRKTFSIDDYNSVFWFSSCCGLFFYILLFFLAPLIADFYRIPELTSLSRFIFIGFFLSSINIAPRALLFRQLKVKETALITVISLALSGLIAIFLAFNGAAYWGLAAQTVSYTFFVTLLSYYFTHWFPNPNFSAKPIKEMFGYSSRIVITNIFNILNNNIFAVLLGKFYTPADVGAFNQANKWNGMGYSTISGIMHNVAQPALAKVIDDKERFIKVFRKLLRFTAFLSFPLMLGLALVSREFIIIAIGEKWLFSALILQLLCLWGAFYPISFLMGNLLLSRGKSNIYMWLTIILAVIQILAVYFSYPYGLDRMLYLFVSINISWVGVWYFYSCRRAGISFTDFLKDTAPFLIISSVAFGAAYYICISMENIYVAFFSKLIIMASVYLSILWFLKAQILRESVDFICHRKV